MKDEILNSYKKGFTDGIPIGLGYLSVAFTFGVMCTSANIPVSVALLISMTNLTSAGQFAGLSLILANASLFEMALTQLIINLRYALMSLSLSQKIDDKVSTVQRCLIAFGNTDEIFAVASGSKTDIGPKYMYGLITAPYLGWSLGTLIGASASSILPASIMSALGIAIYGMFIAIIIPPTKKFKGIKNVIILAIIISCIFKYISIFSFISNGFAIIICTIIASTYGALAFPIKESNHE
ncbi:MAG: AzlC family ABC transporter permease [Erysipelotrichaceae bacterium]